MAIIETIKDKILIILNKCIQLYWPSFNYLIQKEEIETYPMNIIQNHPVNLCLFVPFLENKFIAPMTKAISAKKICDRIIDI